MSTFSLKTLGTIVANPVICCNDSRCSGLLNVLTAKNYFYIANSVRANIAKSGHYVLPLFLSALGKLPAFLPNSQPFIKRQFKLDSSCFCIRYVCNIFFIVFHSSHRLFFGFDLFKQSQQCDTERVVRLPVDAFSYRQFADSRLTAPNCLGDLWLRHLAVTLDVGYYGFPVHTASITCFRYASALCRFLFSVRYDHGN